MTDEQVTLHGQLIKVGDKVWDILYGEGKVKEINSNATDWPITVEFDDIEVSYSPDGIHWDNVHLPKKPSLFWQPFDLPEHVFQKPEPEIDWSKVPQGTPVLVDPVELDICSSSSPRHEIEARFICPTTIFGIPEFIVAYDSKPYCVTDLRLVPEVEVKEEWLK